MEDRSGSPGYKAFRKGIPKTQRLLPFSGKLGVVDTKASGRRVFAAKKTRKTFHLQKSPGNISSEHFPDENPIISIDMVCKRHDSSRHVMKIHLEA